VNLSTLSPTPEQRQLAIELGWELTSPELVAWLQSLLDDEFELLQPSARGQLRARLSGQPQAESCDECGNVFLSRFRPDDARCRVCAAPLEQPPAPPAALRESALEAHAPGPVAWSQGPLSLGRDVVLDAENEDWDERADRLAAERELSQRRLREHELARQQAEARREAREAKRRELTELIPPVSDVRLETLKRKAHEDIEARLVANRRKRRLLRGGKAPR